MSFFTRMLDGMRDALDFVSGANDTIVICHPDGSCLSSPMAVQTNAGVVNRQFLGRPVTVYLNGRQTHLEMHIGDDGRCVFRDESNVPAPQDMQRLPLRDGRNSLDFRIDDTIIASSGLYAWRSTDKIVIVDIDGTVTKTDVGGVLASSEFGQTLGIVHCHEGVCQVLSHIHSGGYRLLFLTARPITRSEATKKYLNQVGVYEGLAMPEGALVTTAMGTVGTVANVWKDLEGYKLAALQNVQSLFNGKSRTSIPCFAGGFGNHDYDSKAYIAAGCPEHRTFRLDEDSTVNVEGSHVKYKGYRGMVPYLPDLFPPLVVVNWQHHYDSSSNKIPGDGLGKARGGVGNSVSGAQAVSKGMRADQTRMPQAQIPGVGVASAQGFGAPSAAEEPPPSYDDAETQGLVDRDSAS